MKKSNDVFFAIAKKQEYLRLNKLSHNTSKKLIEKELKYSCKSYNPIPVVLCRGEGNRIFFLSFASLGLIFFRGFCMGYRREKIL